MKWKQFLIGGAFVGAFSLGAYAAPLNESQAKQTESRLVKI